jgi:hypothetical protein
MLVQGGNLSLEMWSSEKSARKMQGKMSMSLLVADVTRANKAETWQGTAEADTLFIFIVGIVKSPLILSCRWWLKVVAVLAVVRNDPENVGPRGSDMFF